MRRPCASSVTLRSELRAYARGEDPGAVAGGEAVEDALQPGSPGRRRPAGTSPRGRAPRAAWPGRCAPVAGLRGVRGCFGERLMSARRLLVRCSLGSRGRPVGAASGRRGGMGEAWSEARARRARRTRSSPGRSCPGRSREGSFERDRDRDVPAAGPAVLEPAVLHPVAHRVARVALAAAPGVHAGFRTGSGAGRRAGLVRGVRGDAELDGRHRDEEQRGRKPRYSMATWPRSAFGRAERVLSPFACLVTMTEPPPSAIPPCP
ncbi:hypothetical protein SBADM41S_01883 [Streptomyces badius]